MFGLKKPSDMCEECAAANRASSYVGLAGGALLGSAIAFVVLKYVARR